MRHVACHLLLVISVVADILATISSWIISVIEQTGYTGIFILMFLESVALPIPSEITMPLSGFLVTRRVFDFWLVVAAGTFGNLFGSWLLYWIGMKGGLPFIQRYGRWFFISEREILWTERLFERYGEVIIFLGRTLPVVRTYSSFPAGLARMHFGKFSFYTFVGSIPWSIFLTWIGVFLGEQWYTIEKYFRRFDIAIGIIIFAGAAWFLIRHFRDAHEHAADDISR